MNRQKCISDAIDAIEMACEYILDNVPPGTAGKINAVMGLRDRMNQMVIEYATSSRSTIKILKRSA